MTSTRRSLTALLLAPPVALVVSSVSLAGPRLSVDQDRLELEARAGVGHVVLRNDGDEAAQVHLQAYERQVRPDGTEALAPSDALLLPRRGLTIERGGEQRVRLQASLADRQEAVSLVLVGKTLPVESPEVAGHRFEVEVSVVPQRRVDHVAIDVRQRRSRHIGLAVVNRGNGDVGLDRVLVQGLGSDGQVIFEELHPGQILTAGGELPLVQEIPREACSDLWSLVVDATTDRGTYSRTVQHVPIGCPSGAYPGT